MEYILSTIVFLIIFSLLILVHEWGHFYAARRAGVKVEEFGMGLPPRAKGLWKDKKGTLYSLNWIPFGGFVRMYGEDSEDKDMWKKEGSFGSKSIAWRTIIILGGVIMNFLMGFVLLTVLFSVGTDPFIVNADDFAYYREQGYIDATDRVLIGGFPEESAAADAGVLAGDVILSVDERLVATSEEVIEAIRAKAGASIDLLLNRPVIHEALESDSTGAVEMEDQEVPEMVYEELLVTVPVNAEGQIGALLSYSPEIHETKQIQLPIHKAIVQAGYETARLSVLTMKMFVQIIYDLFANFSLSDQVSGPVGIAQLTHQTTQSGTIWDLVKLVAILSISLGAINVIPIPALDGGRFLSILFEIVTRKRPDAAWEARIHAFGFILILILILAVTYNDILKLFQ